MGAGSSKQLKAEADALHGRVVSEYHLSLEGAVVVASAGCLLGCQCPHDLTMLRAIRCADPDCGYSTSCEPVKSGREVPLKLYQF